MCICASICVSVPVCVCLCPCLCVPCAFLGVYVCVSRTLSIFYTFKLLKKEKWNEVSVCVCVCELGTSFFFQKATVLKTFSTKFLFFKLIACEVFDNLTSWPFFKFIEVYICKIYNNNVTIFLFLKHSLAFLSYKHLATLRVTLFYVIYLYIYIYHSVFAFQAPDVVNLYLLARITYMFYVVNLYLLARITYMFYVVNFRYR